MVAWGVACTRPRTEIVATVTSQVPWGPGQQIQTLSVEVRTGDANGPSRSLRLVPLGTTGGLTALPFRVGLLPTASRGANDPTPVWIEALGCAGTTCTRADAVVSQRAVVQFVDEATLDLQLVLATACLANRCLPSQRCEPSSGDCVSATVVPSAQGSVGGDAGAVGSDGSSDVAGSDAEATDVARDALADGTVDVGVSADVSGPMDVVAVIDVSGDAGAIDAGTADTGVDSEVNEVGVPDAGPVDVGTSDVSHRTCPTALALGLFDTGTDGWTFDSLWRHGSGNVVAGSTTRFASTYTQNLTSGADTDLSGCSAALLTFTVRLDDNPSYDSSVDKSERLSPQCSGDGGAAWTNLTPNPWPARQSQCATTYCSGGYNSTRAFAITAQSITLPPSCLTARVRVRFQARGASVWRLQNPGWTIDAVRIN